MQQEFVVLEGGGLRLSLTRGFGAPEASTASLLVASGWTTCSEFRSVSVLSFATILKLLLVVAYF